VFFDFHFAVDFAADDGNKLFKGPPRWPMELGRKFVLRCVAGLLRRQNIVGCCMMALFVSIMQFSNSSFVQVR
jgi:hypothetical protein